MQVEPQDQETDEQEEVTLLAKFRNITFSIMFLMISMGQWNDTKDVAISAYEEVVSRWTNTIQYEKLAKLRIGYSEHYIQTFFGDPQVIKVMTSLEGGVFSYYSTEKFMLTTATKNGQLLGFSVLSFNDDFIAPIVYSDKKLNDALLDSYLPDADTYATDFRNSIYFLEVSELGREHMFYNFSIGTIETTPLSEAVGRKISLLNDQLDRGEEPLLEALEISALLKPNYYSVSEFSNEIMNEAILSKYEMKALFTYE
jgi:hypothetical protein